MDLIAVVTNLGGVPLRDVILTGDLKALGSLATAGVVGDDGALIDPDGGLTVRMPSDIVLAPGQTKRVTLSFEVRDGWQPTGDDPTVQLVATAHSLYSGGDAPDGITTDLTDAGLDPDLNGDGYPGAAFEDDPTPVPRIDEKEASIGSVPSGLMPMGLITLGAGLAALTARQRRRATELSQ